MHSILTRPPKLPPAYSLTLALVCIPVGVVIHGMLGGVLIGAGIGGLLAAAWDFGRLRFVAWRSGRGNHEIESREDRF